MQTNFFSEKFVLIRYLFISRPWVYYKNDRPVRSQKIWTIWLFKAYSELYATFVLKWGTGNRSHIAWWLYILCNFCFSPLFTSLCTRFYCERFFFGAQRLLHRLVNFRQKSFFWLLKTIFYIFHTQHNYCTFLVFS